VNVDYFCTEIPTVVYVHTNVSDPLCGAMEMNFYHGLRKSQIDCDFDFLPGTGNAEQYGGYEDYLKEEVFMCKELYDLDFNMQATVKVFVIMATLFVCFKVRSLPSRYPASGLTCALARNRRSSPSAWAPPCPSPNNLLWAQPPSPSCHLSST